MSYKKSLIISLLASQTLAAAVCAGERVSLRDPPSAPGAAKNSGQDGRLIGTPFDRVATAVDGAESSHGKDSGMWRPDPLGPQGPMQVSEAAAIDVGGGDRFDVTQNRAIGRAYLAQLYWRYRNWPDAIAAYNWGIGKMDAWVKAGRPSDKFLAGVAGYMRRVLQESGLCNGSEVTQIRQVNQIGQSSGSRSRNDKDGMAGGSEAAQIPPGSLAYAACSAPDASGGVPNFAVGPSRFSKKLDQALLLALQHGSHRP